MFKTKAGQKLVKIAKHMESDEKDMEGSKFMKDKNGKIKCPSSH